MQRPISFRFRSTARRAVFATWVQVDVDEPQAVTGVTCSRNKRLNDRLWAELSRVGVSKTDGRPSFVAVAGEVHPGSFFRWWSSAFIVGILDSAHRRVFSFTGTHLHEEDTWTGIPKTAFGLLANLPSDAGQDAFWRTFSKEAGYAKQPKPTKA